MQCAEVDKVPKNITEVGLELLQHIFTQVKSAA